jgi:hypothetical protein
MRREDFMHRRSHDRFFSTLAASLCSLWCIFRILLQRYCDEMTALACLASFVQWLRIQAFFNVYRSELLCHSLMN